jgi:hypothetical protein
MSEDINTIKIQRSETLEEQFIKPLPSIGGHELHPFSAGRKLLLKKLKNELLSGKELSLMEDADFAVLEFIYLHTLSDEAAVKGAYGDQALWTEKVIAFACKCSASMDDEVLAVMEILKRARLADVDIHQKPVSIGAETSDPPPNS